jgi:WD40 repeat protein
VAATRPNQMELGIWSPCNQLIAIISDGTMTVDVVDSVTFQQLQVLEFPQGVSLYGRALVFSPDSCVLTGCGRASGSDQGLFVVSWDLQTGGVTSFIRWQGPGSYVVGDPSITYSANGRMVGILYWYHSHTNTVNIFICDVASGVYICSHSLNIHTPFSNHIWTHREYLRFTTANAISITIWEVGFISGGTPTRVEILPIPDSFDPTMFPHSGDYKCVGQVLLLPTPFRLAATFQDKILVWDVQNSNCLLQCMGTNFLPRMSFSSDGRFFACSTTGADVYLWKEFPTGYVLHGVLAPRAAHSYPSLSQNGESIVVFGRRMIRLWHTNSFTTHPSSISIQAPQLIKNFVLDFSPDGTLVMAAVEGNETVTVLNFKSGVSQLIINAGMDIYGLGMTGNTVVAIGARKVIAWDLPVGNYVPGVRMGFEDRSWAVNLSSLEGCVISASISPDSHHIALISGAQLHFLCIYSTSTGECLERVLTDGVIPWFAPDRRKVWCATEYGWVEVWRFGGRRNVLKYLGHKGDIEHIEHPPEGYPWGSSHSYWVMDDQWILGPDGKRLLMLPPPWQSGVTERVWKGQFLALLHGEISGPVILEVGL